MRRKTLIVSCVALLFCGLTASPAPVAGRDAQERAQDGARLMSGHWIGGWCSLAPKSRGFIFLADLKVEVGPNGDVEGQIAWTLDKTAPDSPFADRIGRTATEYVKGTYDASSRVLSVSGRHKDDPQGIIALDDYRLILADNNRVLGGITSSRDTWQGLMSLNLNDDK